MKRPDDSTGDPAPDSPARGRCASLLEGLRWPLADLELRLEASAAARLRRARRVFWQRPRPSARLPLIAIIIGGSLAGWLISGWAAVAALALVLAVLVLEAPPGGDS